MLRPPRACVGFCIRSVRILPYARRRRPRLRPGRAWPSTGRPEGGTLRATRSLTRTVEEGPMDVSRRDVVVASGLALSASGLLLGGSTGAEAGDEESVAQSVETLRKGLLEADRSKLEQVASNQISYGHSDGRVETK